MERRTFIKKTGAAAAGAMVMPYILPSGRLFAQTGVPLADHLVYVLFAGGVRQQESVLQRYLDDSQNVNIPGNIMYNMLDGSAPTDKIVYGTNYFEVLFLFGITDFIYSYFNRFDRNIIIENHKSFFVN